MSDAKALIPLAPRDLCLVMAVTILITGIAFSGVWDLLAQVLPTRPAIAGIVDRESGNHRKGGGAWYRVELVVKGASWRVHCGRVLHEKAADAMASGAQFPVDMTVMGYRPVRIWVPLRPAAKAIAHPLNSGAKSMWIRALGLGFFAAVLTWFSILRAGRYRAWVIGVLALAVAGSLLAWSQGWLRF